MPKVMVIFLAITLLSSSFTAFSTPVFAAAPGSFIDSFVISGDGGLDVPKNLEFGPDGNLYVLSFQTDEVIRYNGTTGAFIDIFVSSGDGGLNGPQGLIFGPDGNLYVASELTDQVLRYDGSTGVFMDVYVAAGSGGLNNPQELVFDIAGNLYVTSYFTHEVLRYSTATGLFLGPFVFAGSGGLDTPQGLEFGPDGNLYVVSENNGKVLRYNGTTGFFIDIFANAGGGTTPKDLAFGPDGSLYLSINSGDNVKRFDGITGNFIDNFVPGGNGGLSSPQGLVFGSDDRVYITSQNTDEILRFEGPFGDAEPTMSITNPSDDTNYVFGTLVNFTGTSVDPEDGPIHFNITWTSNIDGLLGVGGPPFNNVALSLGNHTITASSTDSFGNTVTDSILVNILDSPPTVDITSPVDGDTFVEGDSITFSGTATDPEDGGISNLIRWYSDDDGLIGVGSSITNSSLSVGSHVITANVTDSFGNTGSHSHPIMINAVPVDSPPTVDITSPVDGDTFVEGDSITLTGIAADAEDGDISEDIIWISDIYGVIGNGSSISSSTAPVGPHIITAEVIDSFGNSGSSSISLTITAEVVDVAPNVSIMSPSEGSIYTNVTTITFSGFAEDPEDGDLSATLNWDSNIEGTVGTGSSFEYSNLSVGTHTIEAKVTDSFGNIKKDSITMIITEDSVELVRVCHVPPGNPINQQQLAIPITALQAHLNHGDYEGACVNSDEEIKKQEILAKVKKQQEEMRNKNELKEKREAFKEIKNEFKDLKKVIDIEKREHIKTIVDDIKEVIKKLKEDPEYDKEHKKIIKTELKEIKQELVQEIRTDAKLAKNKIDSKITKLSKSDTPKITAKKMGLDYQNGKTQIAIELAGKDPAVIEHLSSIGKINAKDDKHVQLTVKLSDLPKLRTLGGIDNIRSPFSAVQFEEALSEGVYFINADLAQFSGITGKGTKVAVLDLAFTDNPKISDNIIEVKSFRQGIGYVPIQGNEDEALHGTAVAEIISDVAPKVELYLYSMETDIEFAAAVDEAISKQVDIIVMSAGWPNFPTDGTSHITKKIEYAVDNGIAFVVPAGNFANKHWEGSYVDSNFNNWHEFSNLDEGLTIEVTQKRVDDEKPIIAHLMWDVGMNNVADFELVLVDPLGQIVDYSANEQKTNSDTSFEYIHYVPDIDGIYSIGVLYAGDMSDVSKRPVASLEIFSINDELEYPISQSSVSVPADASGAIVVGAVNHLDGKLEPFSSQGPTNNGKIAPHVVGPDGVSTLSLGGNPFYGTSATAPYIAGLAALIVQTNPDITPEQLLEEIQQNTESSLYSLQNEFDYAYGYGSANAIFLLDEQEGFE